MLISAISQKQRPRPDSYAVVLFLFKR